MYISFNGNLIKGSDAFASPNNEGFQYGYGLFETLKIVDGKIFFIEEHLARLKKGCKELNIGLAYDLKLIQKYAYALIHQNNIVFGALKILYAKDNDGYDLLITTRKNAYNEEKYTKGFKLCFATTKKNPYAKLTYIKSNNYLENILTKAYALKNGYDEAIFLNVHEKISEGTYTNIFFVKDKIIHTPSISCGILEGIMRKKIIDLIHACNLTLKIGEFNKEDLLGADEIFLTNSLMEIMPVYQLAHTVFPLNKNHMTKRLQQDFYHLYYEK
ncbi:aminotransferase class IV [Marinisporobacter balticus]|uniref:4-amino-4-deoxychorismate lyase n=1 Tax=Marinisporobacter balticus TaxID=2018667 RepID=A0A4R2KVZ1_9FIRM|nr:aminotransferase class IV [Marinisporobacter balticus]TCO74398.1 4-amino-4-deoxychorismate lyase [Marinisporobacter balticus]